MDVFSFFKRKPAETETALTIDDVLSAYYGNAKFESAKGLNDLRKDLEICGYVQFDDVNAKEFGDARFIVITEKTVMIDRGERTVTYKPKMVTGLDNIPDGSIDIYIDADDLTENTLLTHAEAEI